MYKTDCLAIRDACHLDTNAVIGAGLLTLCSIRQPFYNVPAQMQEVASQGADCRFLFGAKRDGYRSLLVNAPAIQSAAIQACASGDLETLVMYLLNMPGLGFAKASFFAQMLTGMGACLDTHNLARPGAAASQVCDHPLPSRIDIRFGQSTNVKLPFTLPLSPSFTLIKAWMDRFGGAPLGEVPNPRRPIAGKLQIGITLGIDSHFSKLYNRSASCGYTSFKASVVCLLCLASQGIEASPFGYSNPCHCGFIGVSALTDINMTSVYLPQLCLERGSILPIDFGTEFADTGHVNDKWRIGNV